MGHGSHTLLGIELYKERPIFYSLGNLVFMNETVPFLPDEAYERFGLGPDATPADFYGARTDNDKKGHPASPKFWQGAVAVLPVQGAQARRSPAASRSISAMGARVPSAAVRCSRAETSHKQIFERLQRLSSAYGTEIVRARRDGRRFTVVE